MPMRIGPIWVAYHCSDQPMLGLSKTYLGKEAYP